MIKVTLCKTLLTRIGALLSAKTIYNLNATLNYLAVSQYMHAHGYAGAPCVDDRRQLFDLVARQISNRIVLYLEFGVYQGEATRYWSKLLLHPQSQLHGFDSFEGLPEDWVLLSKGHFSVAGQLPPSDDPRVRFFKGWFHQTLPTYEPPPHEALVVILDADLYSSTKCVLDGVEKIILPGTYLYFDEFNHRHDELRAFDEFVKRTGMKFTLLGATCYFDKVVFQRTG